MDDRARISHLLRRTTFGPFPGQVEALAGRGYDAALAAVLGASPKAVEPPQLGVDDDEGQLVRWWLKVMASPDAGLHEKLVWFWHGHLTSSYEKSTPGLMWRQHQVLRANALGNFRTMLQKITLDAAMLRYLDGAGSQAAAPNQNYGREVMELFALGRGNYSEADVRSAAEALSGYVVDDDNGYQVRFDPQAGPQRAVPFLGRTVRSAADVVDAICAHDACAPYVAGRLYRYLVGTDPSDQVRAELAGPFRASGLEIAPLVEAILRHPTFAAGRFSRPRFPVEWFTAANAVLGVDGEPDALDDLGQRPFRPPNVAGWPVSPRWLSAGAEFFRARYALDHADDTEVVDASDPVAAILTKASLYEVSAATKKALGQAASAASSRRERASMLHALVVCSPEFCLA